VIDDLPCFSEALILLLLLLLTTSSTVSTTNIIGLGAAVDLSSTSCWKKSTVFLDDSKARTVSDESVVLGGKMGSLSVTELDFKSSRLVVRNIDDVTNVFDGEAGMVCSFVCSEDATSMSVTFS
jgi:hypothetical protein